MYVMSNCNAFQLVSLSLYCNQIYVFDIIGPLQGLFQKGHAHQKQMTLVTTILVDGVSICTLYQNTPHSQRTFSISPF